MRPETAGGANKTHYSFEEEEEEEEESVPLSLGRCYPLISSAHPVCFESSVSRGGGSCPAHPHPTR